LRLDVWLERRLPGLSRARVQALIRTGCVRLAGGRLKAHARVRDGLTAEVELPAPGPAAPAPANLPLAILYEDADIVVVNKPPGLVVHPAAGHASGTLVNALLFHCRDLAGIGGELRPGIVHRLDKDTSGALVVAKNEAALAGLVRQFAAGTVGKEYEALVHGVPARREGRIETLIGRSRHDRKKMSARPAKGRRAVTRYRVEATYGAASRLRIWIETGRTHQIRVHLAHLGHPVLGDRQYGRRAADAPVPAPRQMLHAARLSFAHPRTGARLALSAPRPADFAAALAALGAGDAG